MARTSELRIVRHGAHSGVRVLRDGDVLIGPGKAAILAAIDTTGSVSDAARYVGMPVMLVWSFVQMMNRMFRQPLVAVASIRGNAVLTNAGKTVLDLYRVLSSGQASSDTRDRLFTLVDNKDPSWNRGLLALTAFALAVPVSMLGGLIGLGGAEFRLPVLRRPLGYPTQLAIPLNLAITATTVVTALFVRARASVLVTLKPSMHVILAMMIASALVAFIGSRLLQNVSSRRVERIVVWLLVLVGALLITESVRPIQAVGLVNPKSMTAAIVAAIVGVFIGMFSTLLGVAGGELIIPSLMFLFAFDIGRAGTASLMISAPTVIIGVARYARDGAFANRRDWLQTLLPMAFGSVLGAFIGARLVGIVSEQALKLILGIILIVSALRVFHHTSNRSE